jgi:hypothetical protein
VAPGEDRILFIDFDLDRSDFLGGETVLGKNALLAL